MPCVIGIRSIPKSPSPLIFFIKNEKPLPDSLTGLFINLKTDDNQTSFIFSKKIEQYRFIKENEVSEAFMADKENHFVLNEGTGVLCLTLSKKLDILIWHNRATWTNIEWFYRIFIQQ
ncbi:MAG: hypothetical protein PHE32_00945 [Candidatus Shapirobacteria bacterium]|nr:hypothetical protein [Candidatus Shapirobacteria bacterium]MDD4410259.1 hypothetical protein [Candidatus Shapirobacteria bacterium]